MKRVINLNKKKATAIVEQIADSMEVEVEKNGLDYCFELPEEDGNGYFRGVDFSHGLSLIEGIVIPSKDIRVVFESNNTNPLVMFFNLEDDVTLIKSEENKYIPMEKMKCSFFSAGTSIFYTIEFNSKKVNNFLALVINRKKLENKLDNITSEFSEDDRRIFKDLNGVNNIMQIDFFTLEIGQLIEEIRHCDIENIMKPMFLEGKGYEILTFQLQQFNDRNNKKTRNPLRQATVKKIEEAVEIIERELDQRINVHSLANRVGLNQNTLQSGFKSLYKSSVNTYIKSQRLELAKVLIEENDLNLTEITYRIGINSRSYFSKLFKEKFGISPSSYIGQRQSKDNRSA